MKIDRNEIWGTEYKRGNRAGANEMRVGLCEHVARMRQKEGTEWLLIAHFLHRYIILYYIMILTEHRRRICKSEKLKHKCEIKRTQSQETITAKVLAGQRTQRAGTLWARSSEQTRWREREREEASPSDGFPTPLVAFVVLQSASWPVHACSQHRSFPSPALRHLVAGTLTAGGEWRMRSVSHVSRENECSYKLPYCSQPKRRTLTETWCTLQICTPTWHMPTIRENTKRLNRENTIRQEETQDVMAFKSTNSVT